MKHWLLWLGGVFDKSGVLKHPAISPAANRWQAGLIKAINDKKVPTILLSHLPEPIWPRGKFNPGSTYDLDSRFESYLVSYWNVPFLRSLSLRRAYMEAFFNIVKKQGQPKAIISYNPTPFGVSTGLLAQKQYQIPWINICADSYDLDAQWSQYPTDAKLANGHIFLSYQAFQSCPFQKKLHLDGGVSYLKFDPLTFQNKKSTDKKIILYTGMMSVWGGVSFLLKAFELIHDSAIELWICGHGRNSDLETALKADSRIRFFGLVSESQLIDMSNKASVLINPRPSNISGNAMNFPSKILEYLSYGKPVISTWTPGLSPEYRDVLEVLKEETEECLARTIESVLNWSDNKIHENSVKIEKFLLKEKTWEHQAERLINWLENEVIKV